jgi:hypothetical protein
MTTAHRPNRAVAHSQPLTGVTVCRAFVEW